MTVRGRETSGERGDPVQALCAAGADFYHFGWLLGTGGNLSARLTGVHTRYAISRSGCHKGRLEPEDFLTASVGMTDIKPADARPSAETVIHDALYAADEEIGAVLHVHSPYATALSARFAAGTIPISGWELIKALGFWDDGATAPLPVVPNFAQLDTLAREIIVRRAPATPGVLVAGHGVYAWGETVSDAQRHVEAIEALCQLEHLARTS